MFTDSKKGNHEKKTSQVGGASSTTLDMQPEIRQTSKGMEIYLM